VHATCPSTKAAAFEQLPRSIPGQVEAEDFDPAGFSDTTADNEDRAYRTDTGVDIKSISGGNAVTKMVNGEYVEYSVNVATENDYSLFIRSGALAAGAAFKITQCNQTLVEKFDVPTVAQAGQFKTFAVGKIRLKPGLQKIRINVTGTEKAELDWIFIGDYTGTVDKPDVSNGVVKSEGCGKTRTLQDGNRTISVDGTNRTFILRAPTNYNNQTPYRLIFAYHWRSGNANQVAQGGNGGSTEDPFYGLWDQASNSTIFVAPEGLDAGWANTNGRDLKFTDAMLKQIQSDMCIDNSRIFATGFSYGAGMSNALACARANVFRGVALYAGAQLSGCDGGTAPIAYFHAHGIRDSVLNISQGRSIRDRAVKNNKCTAMSPPEPASGSGTHICTSYQNCTAGFPVRWCAFDGDHNPTEKDRGQAKSWVPGEAWKFISQF
jgi:poly(3-hydroxybutyrate) depolymerase